MDTQNETSDTEVSAKESSSVAPVGLFTDKKKRRIIIGAAAAVVVLALIVRYSGSDSTTSTTVAKNPATTVQSGGSKPDDNLQATVDQAVGLINQRKYDEAIAMLQTVVAQDPNIAIVYYDLGVAYQFKGNLSDAEMNYTKSLTIDNTNPNAYYNRGLSRRDMGNLEGAAADLRVASALAPTWAGAKYNLGQVLYSLGLKEEADKVVAEAQQLEAGAGS